MNRIFCLETEWDQSMHDLKKKSTVLPLLDFLENTINIEYTFRQVATESDFNYYIDHLQQPSYNAYDLIYLCFHGQKKCICFAAKNNWDFKVATEEYLASLAEDTNFERAMSQSWWNKIKFLFLEMLRKAGVKLDRTLRDADLRYILWRSYENLATSGEHGILRAAR